jgi:hypothetical protein
VSFTRLPPSGRSTISACASEEAFKRLKHRLRLEAVTGLDYLALQQDFGAKNPHR